MRAVGLQPDFKTIQVGSKKKRHLHGHKTYECRLYLPSVWYSGRMQTAVRVCSTRREKENNTRHHRGGAKRAGTW